MRSGSFVATLGICIATAQAWANEPVVSVSAEATATEVTKETTLSQVSRIRMFGQNGAMASLFKGMDCVKSAWSSEAVMVSGSMGSAFGSLFGAVSNTSLGIAETETTKNLSQRDGILSKAYFREYEIPADKPTSMNLGFRNVSSFYKGNGARIWHEGASYNGAISFMPKASEDYEVGFEMKGGQCILSVNQVVTKGEVIELVPVPVAPAPSCQAS
jgi:hypothetical protein